MGPRAAARLADGWEASFVTPGWLHDRCDEVAGMLADAGRAPGSLRVSVELDAVLADSFHAAAASLARFHERRGLHASHVVARAVLAGDPTTVAEGIARYAAAGATDLTLGFADFPDTRMLTLFTERVLPQLARSDRC